MTLRTLLLAAAALGAAAAPQAQSLPEWNGTPYAGTVTVSAGFPDDPRLVEVNAGGTLRNPISGAGCVGYVSARPDVVLDYRDAGSYALTISATAGSDVSLVVRTPDGRYLCDDDGGDGVNAMLTIDRPRSGRYQVWAGVYATSAEYVPTVVGFSETGTAAPRPGTASAAPTPTQITNTPMTRTVQPPMTRPVQSPPTGSLPATRPVAPSRAMQTDTPVASGTMAEWAGAPFSGTLVLDDGFPNDPRMLDVVAGGSIPNPLSGTGCVGAVSARPDAVVRYAAGGRTITFSAAAGEDLSLIVRTPGGRYYCDDDSGEGLNPRIDFRSPESGEYRIWVGTFRQDNGLVQARLAVSELGIEAQ